MASNDFEVILLDGRDVYASIDCISPEYAGYFVDVKRNNGIDSLAGYLNKNGVPTLAIQHFPTFIAQGGADDLLAGALSDKTRVIGLSLTLVARYSANPQIAFWNPTAWDLGREEKRTYLARYRVKSMETVLGDVLAILRRLKTHAAKRCPNAKIVLGGMHDYVTTDYAEQIGYEQAHALALEIDGLVDGVFEGNAEYALLEYVRSFSKDVPRWQCARLGRAPIIPSSEEQRKIFKNDGAIRFDRYAHLRPGQTLQLEIARGCNFKCKFCTYRRDRMKPADYTRSESSIYEELLTNYDQYGITTYSVVDDMINDSVDKLNMMERVAGRLPFDFKWVSYARLDSFVKYPETTDILLAAGCQGLLFGIETLHQKAGRAVGKGLGKERAKAALASIRERDKDGQLFLHSSFISGLPFEPFQHHVDSIAELVLEDGLLDSITDIPLVVKPHSEMLDQQFGIRVRADGIWENPIAGFDNVDAILSSLQLMARVRERLGTEHVLFQTFGLASHAAFGIAFGELRQLRSHIRRNEMAEAHALGESIGERRSRAAREYLDGYVAAMRSSLS